MNCLKVVTTVQSEGSLLSVFNRKKLQKDVEMTSSYDNELPLLNTAAMQDAQPQNGKEGNNRELSKKIRWGQPHIIWIFFHFLMSIICMTVVTVILPQVIVEMCDGDISLASRYQGIIIAVNSFASFASSALLGTLSDLYGRKKLLFVAACGFMVNLATVSFSPYLWTFIVSAGLSGALSCLVPVTAAYIADTTDPRKRAQNFAIIGVVFGVSFISVPISAGYLAEIYGLSFPFYIAMTVLAVDCLYIALVLPESGSPKGGKIFLNKINPLRSLWLLRTNKIAIGMAVVCFLQNLAESGVFDTFVVFLKYRYGWGARDVGIAMSVAGVSSLIVQGVIIRLMLPYFGERKSLMIGLVIKVVASIPLAIITTEWMFYPIIIFRSLGMVSGPTLEGILSNQYSSEQQGELLGVLAAIKTLAAFVGPLIYNSSFSFFISDAAPFTIPGICFYIDAIMILACVIITIVTFKLNPTTPVTEKNIMNEATCVPEKDNIIKEDSHKSAQKLHREDSCLVLAEEKSLLSSQT